MEGKEGKFAAFPFKAYSIQMDFMNTIYHSLNRGGVSILESPTGSGKTMSVICSALQWVLDQRRQEESQEVCHNDEANVDGSDDEPDWMRNFFVSKDQQAKEEKMKIKKDRFSAKPDKKKEAKGICKDFGVVDVEDSPAGKRRENLQKKIDAADVEDKEFLLEEYESEDEEAVGNMTSKRKSAKIVFNSSSKDESDDGDEKEEEEKKFKVFFCSRTHSQLSQFIKELQKIVFASEMSVVSLGSRKNLCINEGSEFT